MSNKKTTQDHDTQCEMCKHVFTPNTNDVFYGWDEENGGEDMVEIEYAYCPLCDSRTILE